MLCEVESDIVLYNSYYLASRKSLKKIINVSWHIKQVLQSEVQNILLRGGYGAGKSNFLAMKAAYLIKRDRVNILMMTLTYGYIYKILIPYCVRALDLFGLPYEINLQNKQITVFGYAHIYFFSYSDPSAIVSLNVGHMLFDEFDEQEKERARLVFEHAGARKRLKIASGRTAQTIIATTPKGIGSYCYDLFESKNKTNPNFTQFEVPTFANYKNLRDSYVMEQMAILPKNKILSHIYGKWAPSTTELVYHCFSDENKINKQHPLYPKDFSHILVGMDFNIGKMAAVIGVELIVNNIRYIIIFDEITDLKNTEEMIKEIKKRYQNSFVTVYPDYSGGGRTTSSNDTDISLLKASGIRVITQPNPLVRDRVNVVNSTFENAIGQRTTFIDVEKCRKLITALTSQGYNNTTGEPDKTQGHDHILDGLGYLIYNRVGKTQIKGYK